MSDKGELEIKHPSGRALTELERCLICLRLVGLECTNARKVFRNSDDRKRDPALIFTWQNHAGILVFKFLEAWRPFCAVGKSDLRVRRITAALRPILKRIDHWPGLADLRNLTLAHPYRRKGSNKVVLPSHVLALPQTPTDPHELMQLIALVQVVAAGALAFFETEWWALETLLTRSPEPTAPRQPVAHRVEELNRLAEEANAELARRGVDLQSKVFDLFM